MNQNYAYNVGDNNEAPAVPVIAPTCRDVLNGRGQGVQRHPGNEKYRKLVFVNKGLYAKCPKTDKIKISRVGTIVLLLFLPLPLSCNLATLC